MEAVVASEAELPSCSYYDEDIGRWDSSGLVVESVTELSTGAIGAVDVLVSCVSFHLSDFTVATTEAEAVFQPVPLVRIIDQEIVDFTLCWNSNRRGEHRCAISLGTPGFSGGITLTFRPS